MILRFTSAFLLLGSITVAVIHADESKPTATSSVKLKLPPGFDPEKMADPKEALKAAEWIEKEYSDSPRPEAVRMLLAILRGSRMDGSDGWFGPADNRYTWKWLATRAGVEPVVGGIPKVKFKGDAALFDRLDRDGDGKISPADLDWSDRSPYVVQAGQINRLFRRMDWSGDGRLTREELDKFFDLLAAGKDHITAEDLRQAMIPRGPMGFSPGDGPSTPVLIRGLFAGEIGSMSEGPHLEEKAPDFVLKTADGKQTIQLAKLIGSKPVVLIFGNFTCGPFRALYPDIESMYRRYQKDATFLMVYVREAHPTDGWRMESNTRAGVKVAQPTTLDERVLVCEQFCQKLKPSMPVVVDPVTDPAGTAYSGMPGRLYVVDRRGKVAYKSGRGPFGFRAGELEQALVMALLESNDTQ